ncbi:NPCBM/NEW2 domain-containing protein [Nonomuraea sp. NPDC050663]|uniref:NPCBM/NEW2 domain-containing protein n=1 Tax=Nonomuraea sp. NPDC050663 TaxID=3364370 RepID=UPI0037A32FB4
MTGYFNEPLGNAKSAEPVPIVASSTPAPPSPASSPTSSGSPVGTAASQQTTSAEAETESAAPAVFLEELPVVAARFHPRLGASFSSENDAGFVGFQTGVIEAGGNALSHSIYKPRFSAGDEAFVEYNLSRDYSVLSFQAVLDDSSDTDGEVSFEILVDGKSAKRVTAAFGSPAEVSISIKDSLRLRIAIVRLDRGTRHVTAGMGEATATLAR